MDILLGIAIALGLIGLIFVIILIIAWIDLWLWNIGFWE